MTAKEKAAELVEKFKPFAHTFHNSDTDSMDTEMELKHAKECARIAAEEIISEASNAQKTNDETLKFVEKRVVYWQQVLTEIDKIA